MPKEVKANGGGGSSSRGGNQDGSDKFQLDELSSKFTEKMTLMERRRAGKPAASDSSLDGSSPTSSIEDKELNGGSPSTRRLEGRKKTVIGGSLSSADADVSSSSLSTSTDGEVEMCSSSSPTSFNWKRLNAAGSKVKTSTPKDKGYHAGGGGDGDGGVCVAAPAFEPSAGLDREDGGYGGGDGDGYGEGLGGGNSDWFGLAAPKFGTPVPNRIFIGGISCQTTENDLVRVFSKYGEVRGAKIILDRGGVSKGYGFVTFETAEEATALCDSIVNKTFEPIILRDRRLNIAPAIKKQPGICSDSGFSSDGSLQRPGGHYSGPHNITGGYYYPNQYQIAPPPIQPQYYDFPQPASPTGNQYLEQYLQHYAAAAAYAQPMTAPPAHQPQPGAYAVPQYYAAAPAQAPGQMAYYEGGAPTPYQYPVAAGSWADWSSAPMIPGVPAYYYNYPAWDPNAGIPAAPLPNHVQYQ